MKEAIYKIKFDTSGAVKDVKEVNNELENTKKASKDASKGTKSVGGGFKAMGTAMKAAGIGLIIALFMALKTALEGNQKVMTALNVVTETISIVFSEVANVLSDVYENVSSATENFDALGKVMGGIVTIVLTPFKIALQGLKASFYGVQLAWESSFLGGKDPEKIAFLKSQLEEVKEEVIKIGTEAVDAGGQIVDNIAEAVTEVGDIGTKVITGLKTISIDAAIETAKTNVSLKSSAQLAAVANQGLIEKYDILAEKQRQIRDDDRNSIADRIAANEELGKVLEKQQSAMLENAQISLRSAKAELKKDKNNIELKKAVMEAENELVAVRATVEGFRSEQLTNLATLEKEEKEMINSRIESEANLSIEQKRFNAEQIEDEVQRLKRLKEIDVEEGIMQSKRLQSIIDNAKEGTQAKIDAEIALNEFTQANNQQIVTRDAEIAAAKKAVAAELAASKKQLQDAADAQKELDDQEKLENAEELNAAIIDGVNNSLDIVNDLAEMQKVKYENLNKEILSAHEELNANILANDSLTEEQKNAQLATAAIAANKLINENNKQAKKAFDLQKKVSIAKALIDTFLSAQASFTALAGIPVVGPVLGGIAAAAAITGGLLNVQAIKNQKFEGAANIAPPKPAAPSSSSSGGGGGGGTSPSQAPNFNVVGQSGFNQVAGALGTQAPVQAFVVAGSVTTAQQLQNNTIQQATF